MGFYGNVTNTVKTNLQFDKRYSNRFEMEARCATDGVYSGRYILIEYDLTWDNTNLTNDKFVILYEGTLNGVLTQSTSPDLSVRFTPEEDIIYRVVEIQNITTGLSVYTNRYYIGVKNEDNSISLKMTSNSNSAYVTNFNIDTNYYGDGRGWDSTVWMKTYDTDGIPQYVNVAELNSVVPTFAISVDAPTEIPQSPHFDESNTNIFYTVHLQPQWGIQIKEAEHSGSSDVRLNRTYRTYDENNIIQNERTESNVPMNIYYNAAGFDVAKKTVSNLNDSVRLENTGISGKYYNNPSHEPGAPAVTGLPDIYEFSMLLPSLGNAVAKMWDAVYDVDESNTRKRDVAWKDAFERNSEDTNLGGMSITLNTLAGTINAAHKIMGMIVTDKQNSYLNEVGYNNHFIYKSENKYYRIIKAPIMEKANSIESGVAYFVKGQDGSYTYANSNVANRDYYYISGYNYEYVELVNFNDTVSTMNGLLLKMAQMLDLNNVNSVDTDTVQGCINKLNSIINVFDMLTPGEFVIVDNEGKVVSSSWTTKQTFGYTNEYTGESNNETAEEENCWITTSINPANKLITIIHNLARNIKGSDVITDFDDNTYTNSSASFSLYTPIVDNAGHVVGKNTEAITLPSGIKHISSNGLSEKKTNLGASSEKDYSYTSDNIKDEFNIDVGNAWLESTIDKKTLTIAHKVNSIATTPIANTNLNATDENEQIDTDTINLQDIVCDEAGHITSNIKHSYTLPYSYKYLKTSGNANSVILDFKTITTTTDDQGNTSVTTNPPAATAHNANKVFSTLNLNPYNKWIQTKIVGDENSTTVQIAHMVPHEIAETALTNYLSNSNFSFVTTNFTYDEAGHILTKQNITNSLPNNFSQYRIVNDGGAFIPCSAYDTLYLSGDQWIGLSGSMTDANLERNNTLVYNHGDPTADTNKVNLSSDNVVTPAFGGQFKVPTFTYDGKGHVYSATSYDITLPPITTSDSTSGNVIVASSVDSTDSGKLLFTKANVGTLALTDYSIGASYSALAATDPLNTAIGKLEAGHVSNQTILNTLTGSGDGSISKMIDTAIEGVTGGSDASLSSLSSQVATNDQKLTILMGDGDGSIANTVSTAINTVTGGDTTTIKALNEALLNKVDTNATYTVTSSDGTKTLTGDIETILKDMLDLILENNTPSTENENTGTTE